MVRWGINRMGHRVEYGPIRAGDLPEYLKTHRATPEMRRVRFSLKDRFVLVPVELVGSFLPMVIAAVFLFFLGGLTFSLAGMVAFLSGAVLFPVLLPWIPTPNFSSKGFILGWSVALPFALAALLGSPETVLWNRILETLTILLVFPPVTAFLALNFTGATPVSSKSGVKYEMSVYIPVMAWMLGIGILIPIGGKLIRLFGDSL